MRSHKILCSFALAAALLVTACHSSDDDDDDRSTNFQSFVQNLATTPVDDGDPVPINDLDFDINEDPNAFDALFQ